MSNVLPGERIQISAKEWNEMRSAFRAIRKQGGISFLKNGLRSGMVMAKNNTVSEVGRFGVMEITGVVVPYATDDDKFFYDTIFECDAPVVAAFPEYYGFGIVIAAETIAAGQVGKAFAFGVCPALVNISDVDHYYANPTNGVTTKLTSCERGIVRIAQCPPEATGDTWCLVALDQADAARVMKVDAEIEAGATGTATPVYWETSAFVEFGASRSVVNGTDSAIAADTIVIAVPDNFGKLVIASAGGGEGGTESCLAEAVDEIEVGATGTLVKMQAEGSTADEIEATNAWIYTIKAGARCVAVKDDDGDWICLSCSFPNFPDTMLTFTGLGGTCGILKEQSETDEYGHSEITFRGISASGRITATEGESAVTIGFTNYTAGTGIDITGDTISATGTGGGMSYAEDNVNNGAGGTPVGVYKNSTTDGSTTTFHLKSINVEPDRELAVVADGDNEVKLSVVALDLVTPVVDDLSDIGATGALGDVLASDGASNEIFFNGNGHAIDDDGQDRSLIYTYPAKITQSGGIANEGSGTANLLLYSNTVSSYGSVTVYNYTGAKVAENTRVVVVQDGDGNWTIASRAAPRVGVAKAQANIAADATGSVKWQTWNGSAWVDEGSAFNARNIGPGNCLSGKLIQVTEGEYTLPFFVTDYPTGQWLLRITKTWSKVRGFGWTTSSYSIVFELRYKDGATRNLGSGGSFTQASVLSYGNGSMPDEWNDNLYGEIVRSGGVDGWGIWIDSGDSDYGSQDPSLSLLAADDTYQWYVENPEVSEPPDPPEPDLENPTQSTSNSEQVYEILDWDDGYYEWLWT